MKPNREQSIASCKCCGDGFYISIIHAMMTGGPVNVFPLPALAEGLFNCSPSTRIAEAGAGNPTGAITIASVATNRVQPENQRNCPRSALFHGLTENRTCEQRQYRLVSFPSLLFRLTLQRITGHQINLVTDLQMLGSVNAIPRNRKRSSTRRYESRDRGPISHGRRRWCRFLLWLLCRHELMTIAKRIY